MTVRRVRLEDCCDYLVIRGGRSPQPEYRYPRRQSDSDEYARPLSGHLLGVPNRRDEVEELYYSNGAGDVLEFSEPVITVTLFTDHSVASDGFELLFAPSESTRSNTPLLNVAIRGAESASVTFSFLCTGPLDVDQPESSVPCGNRSASQENQTLAYGSLNYRPTGSRDMCLRRDWLFTHTSASALGYMVTIQSLHAERGAGSLSIGPVGGGPDARTHKFYGLESQFRDSPPWNRRRSIARIPIVSRSMLISLRASDYFAFELSFTSLSGALRSSSLLDADLTPARASLESR